MPETKEVVLPLDDWKLIISRLRDSSINDIADAVENQLNEVKCPYHLTDFMIALIDFARACGGMANSREPVIAAAMSKVVGAVASFAEDESRVGGLAESAREFAAALGERSLDG